MTMPAVYYAGSQVDFSKGTTTTPKPGAAAVDMTVAQKAVDAMVAMATRTNLSAELQNALNDSHSDAMWMIIAGVLVFLMQAGFAMLEAGSVRAKNTKSIMLKNLLDASAAALGWTMLGYYIAFPPSDKRNNQANSPHMDDKDLFDQEKDFFFQFTFNATAATIVSGALAERTKIEGYILFTLVMTVVIYPIIVSWTWGYGMLYQQGYNDFAGSGIVHMTGGMAALAAAICVGARKGRFDGSADSSEFLPSNFGMVCLGTLILWVGWYGFNAGSTLSMSSTINMGPVTAADVAAGRTAATGDILNKQNVDVDMDGALSKAETTLEWAAKMGPATLGASMPARDAVTNLYTPARATYNDAGRCAMTTTIGAAAGGMFAFIMGSLLNKHYDVMSYCNGILAGLVSVTAGTGTLDSHMAMITGATGGMIYLMTARLMERLQVDDPLGAVGVHGTAGAWGVMAHALFSMDVGWINTSIAADGTTDLAEGSTTLLWANLLGVVVIAGFSFGASMLLFTALRVARLLRVSEEVEEAGCDAECQPKL